MKKCQKGHVLHSRRQSRNSWVCDGCKMSVNAGESSSLHSEQYRCEDCDFNQCEKCYKSTGVTAKTAKEDGDYIKLKIISQDSNKKNFRIKRNAKIGKLKKTYAQTDNIAATSISFVFRGNVIKDDETPQSLEMIQNDIIEAQVVTALEMKQNDIIEAQVVTALEMKQNDVIEAQEVTALEMKQNDVIEAQEVTAVSFDDLLVDLELIKVEMKISNSRAGSSASIPIDENTVFQYLEEAREDPNRVEVVCNRLKAGQKGETSKKRKREVYMTNEDNELEMLNYLREMFPDLPEPYLEEKARKCKDGNIQRVVESILNDDNQKPLNTEDASCFEGESIIGNDIKNVTLNADESDLGGKLADTSMIDDESVSALEQSNGDYIQDNYQTLVNIFPDVDPEYLREQSWNIEGDPGKLEAFISSSLEKKSILPSRKDYEKRKSNRDEQQKIKMLTVNDFLEMWEDPHAHFADISPAVSELYKKHALFRLRKAFPVVHHTDIVKALEENNYHFFPALKKIQNLAPKKGKKRQVPPPQKPSEMETNFLKEYIYSKLESQIRRHQEKLEADHKEAVEKGRSTGGLFECGCCFEGDCLLSEVAMCEQGHMFCTDCLRRGAGVQIGDQKTQISCLIDCGSAFSLSVLQSKLSNIVFSRLVQKRQLEEIQAAGLDDLVQCPACNFATIMPDPSDKVVRCQNPECGKVSCRQCQEDNHIPLTCDEVEKDSDVADRVKLENAMTEAMLRTCVACQKKFFKEDGCNKMKCSCGATMCYLCRKPVPDNYSHFYGQGADPKDGTCPLWSDNKNLHKEEVFQAAKRAKKDLNKNIKYDPTKDLEKPPEGFNPNELHANDGAAMHLNVMAGGHANHGGAINFNVMAGGQDFHNLIYNRVMQMQMQVMQMRGARSAWRIPQMHGPPRGRGVQMHHGPPRGRGVHIHHGPPRERGMLIHGPPRGRAVQANRQLRRPPQGVPEFRPEAQPAPPQEVINVDDD